MVSTVYKILVTALAAFALLFSGCVGGTPKGSSANAGGALPSLTVNQDVGAIQGTVTDDEQRLLPDVDVGLRGKSLVTATNKDGQFQFAELMPGTYTVDIARLGFSPVAQDIVVKAAEVSRLDAVLKPLAVTAASYYETFPFSVFYDCALGTAEWVSACSFPYTAVYYGARDYGGQDLGKYGVPSDIQKNTFRYNFTVKPGAVDVVSEAQWVPASAAATTMQLLLSCANYDPVLDDCLDAGPYASVGGKSPLRVDWQTQGKVKKPPEWVMARIYLPFDGAQVALSQKVDVWNSVWYNEAAPKGWNLVSQQKN